MCGIAAIWNRESIFDLNSYDIAFEGASERGQDGYGISIWNKKSYITFKSLKPYKDTKKEALDWLFNNMKVNSIIIANFRAQPATEVNSSGINLQPIIRDGLGIVHNGVVADFIVNKYNNKQTQIDSEIILLRYLQDRNIKNTVEELVGGFSFILFDSEKNRLYAVCDYKPLSIGYLRGKGLILHSSEDAIQRIIEKENGINHCGSNVWEDYYYHWQDTNTIREIDIDSGMERLNKFVPRFVTPVIDTKNKGNNNKVLAIASGGIDSITTAYILKKLGYDVELIHFDYGQKGEKEERFAIEKIADEGHFKAQYIDLKWLFKDSNSSLVNKDIPILTATEDYMKTTTSWVECRNMIFLSIVASIAEKTIIKYNLENIYICAGFISLEEEGFYPDDSERFVKYFMSMLECASIVSNRIKFVNVLQNIMKYETICLGDKIGVPWQYTVSCDTPKIENNNIYLCNQCGSTLISRWAFEQAGVLDNRKFYDIDINMNVKKKKVSETTKNINIVNIIDRLKLIKNTDNDKLKGTLI